MTTSRKKSVTQLAAELLRLSDDYDSRKGDDEKIDGPQLKLINAIGAKIVKSTFKKRADRAAGWKILARFGEPSPDDWCSFKVDLYMRMQQFGGYCP
jgi:hypothetical protein